MVTIGDLPSLGLAEIYLVTNETANLSQFPWFSGVFGECIRSRCVRSKLCSVLFLPVQELATRAVYLTGSSSRG